MGLGGWSGRAPWKRGGSEKAPGTGGLNQEGDGQGTEKRAGLLGAGQPAPQDS